MNELLDGQVIAFVLVKGLNEQLYYVLEFQCFMSNVNITFAVIIKTFVEFFI